MENPLENPAKMDDLGVPSFQKTPRDVPQTWGGTHGWKNSALKQENNTMPNEQGLGLSCPNSWGLVSHHQNNHICWRWNIPIVGWWFQHWDIETKPWMKHPHYGPIGFIWGGWKTGLLQPWVSPGAAWPSGLQASSLAVMVWFSESPCVGNLAWGVMGPHE